MEPCPRNRDGLVCPFCLYEVTIDVFYVPFRTSVPRAFTYPIKPHELPKTTGNETDFTNVNISSVGPVMKVTFEVSVSCRIV